MADRPTRAEPTESMPPPIQDATPLAFDELKQLEFLQGLSDDELRSLAPGVWERTFAEGETVLRTGDYGDAAYYILDGFAEARLLGVTGRERRRRPSWSERLTRLFARPETSASASARDAAAARQGAAARQRFDADGTIVLNDLPVDVTSEYRARLQKGDIFGEVSALSRYPHSTDLVALTPLRCVVLPTPTLRRLKNDVDAFAEMVDTLYVERTLDIHLAHVDLFAGLPAEIRKALRDAAELCTYFPNQEIAAQGDPCEDFYLVRGGYVKVAVREEDRELAVTYLRKGDYAGEIGLLLEEPWPFTLTALEHVELVRIGREQFRRALEVSPRVEEELWTAVVARLKERGFAVRNPSAVESLRAAMDTGLIHGESVLLIDLNTCTKCDDCVRACATTHGGVPRFVREGARVSHYSVPTACYQCTDPVCMIGCPTGAISRPLGNLQVLIDDATCIGCHRCVNGCPWHNIVPVPFYSKTLQKNIELATKCDLCVGRDEGPACVQMCPHGSAIRVDFKDSTVVQTLFSKS